MSTFTTVRLPQGYDDRQDRPQLMGHLHAINEGFQVSHIIGDIAYVTTGNLEPEPASLEWELDPSARAIHAKRVGEQIRREAGLTMVRYEPDSGVAVGAPLGTAVVALRDAIARFAGAAETPWEVSITVRWATPVTGEPYISEVHVHRMGKPILNRGERLTRWREIIYAVIPLIDGTAWMLDDRYAQGDGLVATRMPDPLLKAFTLEEFERDHRHAHLALPPEKSWKGFPVAVRENGEPVQYTLFHTLCVGQTGAGKGSVLWGIISGLIPAIRAGLVEIYVIDPKNAEAKDPVTRQRSGLFKKVATTPEEWDELLQELVDKLKQRQEISGRSFEPTRETPLVILLVDELSALAVLDADPKRAKRVEQNQLIILSQGRSDGFTEIAAVQGPQKEMIGKTRQFFAMRVALRTETAVETNLALGDGMVEAGALSHLIPPANPGNGYASSGIGYIKVEGESEPVRVRFPYTDDDQLHAWSQEFANHYGRGSQQGDETGCELSLDDWSPDIDGLD